MHKQKLNLIMNHLAVCGFALVYTKINDINNICLYLKEDPDTKISLLTEDKCGSALFSTERTNDTNISIKTFNQKIKDNESEISIERLELIPELKPLLDQYSYMS